MSYHEYTKEIFDGDNLEYSDGRVEKKDRYIKYNIVSDKCDDVMKALDIAKTYSLEYNTRCVVASDIFGYDRYMGSPT